MDFDPVPYDLVGATTLWCLGLLIVSAITLVTLTITSILTVGATGPLRVLAEIRSCAGDWFGTSPRRLGALALLTIRESIRRKSLFVFVVFAVLFLFAGWFMRGLPNDSTFHVNVYVSFVLRTISWLTLVVMLLLACWGLPEDIKARSLHTVVTKPVRKNEVVLGRILGYAAVGGLVLLVMGVVGYFWILRQLPAQQRSRLVARVPVYGALTFLDREGSPAKEGVNTGDIWMFRSYIEGNTKARAMWDFQNIDPARLQTAGGGALRLESNFQVFRTYKGNIERGILCQFVFVNEARKIRAPVPAFEVQEFRENLHTIAPELTDEAGKPVNLFTDLIQDGNLKIEVRCLSGQQFLGVARPDLFIRLPDRTFAETYFKGVLGIGLMLFLVIVLGVVASSFLKGPIATILAVFVLIVGRMARPFLESMTAGEIQGVGALESLYKIPAHINPSVQLDPSAGVKITQAIDSAELNLLWAIKFLFPEFKYYDMAEYVAKGYDVPWSAAILPSLAITIVYALPWILLGHVCLKLRELESK